MTQGTFQEIIRKLNQFWEEQGCIVNQGYDLEMGAGTFNPATFLRCLGPEPYSAAYVEACRRPTDGRYGENPNRVQHYYQYQVVMKPSPLNLQDLYLDSLRAIGFDLSQHDVRFVHDDWESPTLGAWGLGWEVWMDGMEVTQFTYFQACGGLPLSPVTGELTYGLERLAMYLLAKESIFDLPWNKTYNYGDLYHRSEVEWSQYNFEEASTEMWFRHFDDYEREAKRLIEFNMPLPAYDFVMKASHAFNLLDARGVISVTERMAYILKIRTLSKLIAECYVKSREEQGFPLLEKISREKPAPQEPELPSMEFEAGAAEDFVLEIGSEELPATFVPIGCDNLKRDLCVLLDNLGLSYAEVRTTGTPRRLTAFVKGLSSGKASKSTERRGPATDRAFDAEGQPTKAAEGFFKSLKIEPCALSDIEAGSIEGVELRELKGARYIFASVSEAGCSAAHLLAKFLPSLVLGLDWPKSMRWSDLDISYARPLRWIVALHGDRIIPFRVGNVVSGNTSAGHPQLSSGPVEIADASTYFDNLRDRKVLVDTAERRQSILEQLAELETEMGAKAVAVDDVLPQVLHLTEWPQLTYQDFEAKFLKVPREVLISEMVEHQKYFPVEAEDGKLKNTFIITADTLPSDAIRHGNGRVLSARLSDGNFLFEQDMKQSLDAFVDKLKTITFLRGMGSMYEKAQRLVRHVEVIHGAVPKASLEACKRAALICKADLASGMVYEFPDLQGVMGRYYATAHEEDPAVALAIDEHWMPRGEHTPLPESAVGVVVALADKIDKLLACFAAGQKPKSSSDPHALRRQVLGIIKILIKHEVHLDFPATLERCSKAFPDELMKDRHTVCQDILGFITNRIRSVFQDFDLSKDETEASLAGGWSDIYNSFQKVRALHNFRQTHQAFPLLMEVHKRAKGQIGNEAQQTLKHSLCQEDAEKSLVQALEAISDRYQFAVRESNYGQAYELLASLQPPLARLFDDVKILADDPEIRSNRIALLQSVFGLFGQLVDFSKIQQNRSASPQKS